MQASSATPIEDSSPSIRQRVRDCCYDFRQYKLSTAEVSVLTNLPTALVDRALQELRVQDELPLQYLDHRLS